MHKLQNKNSPSFLSVQLCHKVLAALFLIVMQLLSIRTDKSASVSFSPLSESESLHSPNLQSTREFDLVIRRSKNKEIKGKS